QAILWEAFEAAKRGEDDASAVGTFAKVFAQQWLGNPANNSLMMGAALVQATGIDPRTGRPINSVRFFFPFQFASINVVSALIGSEFFSSNPGI
ncbi:hypothetical protein ACI3PL_20075, partial [Lacticaseibacillus paracasei]